MIAKNKLHCVVPGESWGTFFKTVLGTWMAVWLYAAIHNQYLIRIAPEHFTEWHYKMPFFTSYTMLGIAYAFAASSSPGIVLGMCLFVAGRLFDRPKLSIGSLILSTAWVWIGVEICAISAGIYVGLTGRELYPEWVYPDNSLGLMITQTIQVTAYLIGALLSLILIGWTWRRRKNPAT